MQPYNGNAMNIRQLYNIETDTLLALNPKDLSFHVKGEFSHFYFASVEKFAIVYFLFNAYPHVVSYKEFSIIFDELHLECKDRRAFDKRMTAIKKELTSHGVKDLIVKVRGHGYGISNKWVPPEQNTESKRKARFAKLSKLLGVVLPSYGGK